MKKFIYPVLLAVLSVFLLAPQSTHLSKCWLFMCRWQWCSKPWSRLTGRTYLCTGQRDYEVRLMSGTFNIPTDIHFTFETSRSPRQSAVAGMETCTGQATNPRLTNLEGGATQASLDGGGVLLVMLDNDVSTPVTFSISNLSIRNGSSIYDGGGLSIAHGLSATAEATATIDISNVIIELNTTEEWFGSGIAISDYGTDGGIDVNITRSIVQTNGTVGASAALPGPGGIFIDNYGAAGGEITIARSQILNNTAEADSGGLFINNGAKNLTLVNNVIAGNESLDGYGGGLSN